MAPITVTIYVFNLLVTMIGGGFRRHFFFWLPEASMPTLLSDFIATLAALVAITFLGYISRWFFARFLVNTTEKIIDRLPFINTVYKSVKQIVETFSEQNKAVFQEVVLIEYPRPGIFAIGFRTGTSGGEIQERTASEVDNVFVPTTPNPTSGFLLMLPKQDIIKLDMTIGDGMKLIISGGAVVPEYDPTGKKVIGARTAKPILSEDA
ncbi:MAG TPA: DUF502 domain-containing protein [Opitutales bacterium]|nr:DUF502 domain-containing protein [Opitutales bacterium]